MKSSVFALAAFCSLSFAAHATPMEYKQAVVEVSCKSIFNHRETVRVSSKVTRWLPGDMGVGELVLTTHLPSSRAKKYILRSAMLNLNEDGTTGEGSDLLIKASRGREKLEIEVNQISSEFLPASIKINGVEQDFLNLKCSVVTAG